MSKLREFWIRNNQTEFGLDGTALGKSAFDSPFGVKGKDGKDCDLIHVRVVDPDRDAVFEEMLEALSKTRGQWIHSVHAKECLEVIAKAEKLR